MKHLYDISYSLQDINKWYVKDTQWIILGNLTFFVLTTANSVSVVSEPGAGFHNYWSYLYSVDIGKGEVSNLDWISEFLADVFLWKYGIWKYDQIYTKIWLIYLYKLHYLEKQPPSTCCQSAVCIYIHIHYIYARPSAGTLMTTNLDGILF